MDNKQNLDENIQKLTSSLNDTNDLIEEYRNTIKDNFYFGGFYVRNKNQEKQPVLPGSLCSTHRNVNGT